MKKSTKFLIAAAAALLMVLAIFATQRWRHSPASRVAEMLAVLMEHSPGETSGVLYVDVAQLRQSPFAQKLFTSAPKPQADAEYTRFIQETGFDYERDLDRAAFSASRHGAESIWFAIVDGNFDQEKIAGYLSKIAAVQTRDNHEIFLIPAGSPAASAATSSAISLTFLRPDRIAATNGPDISAILATENPGAALAEWQSRFTRLAGSPIFVVARQDASAIDSLAAQAPGGLQSPQLSALLAQLRWLTLAGQPQSDSLRLVAEGETSSDTVARQLADMLNGVIILAQAGLNDPKARQQLDPETRAAYLDLLKSAEVAQMDRQETKAVRVVLEITPSVLNAATRPKPPPPLASQSPAAVTPKRQSR
jgi:hypothetical protein